MKHFNQIFIWALMLAGHCQSLPTKNIDIKQDPELKGNFFEGDMDIDLSRNGLRDSKKRWPNAIVRYKLDSVFDVDHALFILQGMKNIETVSCIRFLPASDTTNAYVKINGQPNGCNAKVGYSGFKQNLNLELNALNKGCFRIGSIMHELLHVLGFYHQHSASDRDDYILIVRENIITGMEYNFNKFNSTLVTDFGVEYDYGSVMHYSGTAFTKNGQKTIIPLQNESIELGQRRELSEKDILKLNKMYKCAV